MMAMHVKKSGLLIGVCVLSALTASRLMARKHQEPRDASQPAFTKKGAVNGLPDAIPEGAIPVTFTAEFKMSDMTVTGGAGQFGVDAEVEYHDSRDGTSYMWSLFVMDHVDSKILSRIDYQEQIFSAPAKGEPLKARFQEIVPFRPGTYNVAVQLSEVTGLEDVSVLKNPDRAAACSLATDVKEVTVE
ncbi:hypothetical protein [Paludisphaera borealis]|uniref:Uncharacterized protein n=1 Tax=Paludisphaera borealis TaxID=1387353 RepID=A0A1U7CTY8_9BACT|nr:hypothetical protein [Paludisphaera borealis]APW62366.1 hypothetical protein BSF38_03905 [Paludisphaera borealis]